MGMEKYTAKEFAIPAIEGISREAIDVHLGLYQGYVSNLNAHYEQIERLRKDNPEDTMLVSALTRRIVFELAGVKNHDVYFGNLVGGAMDCPADSPLHAQIQKQYGSCDTFKQHIHDTAAMMRGIGWTLVLYDKEQSAFHIVWVTDHELGNVNLPAVIALDMWEHAYMVDYRPATKKSYINAYLNALNWRVIADRFSAI